MHAAGADIPDSAASRRGMLPALAGLAVGLAYATISVYWAVGGRWLLNTVGISLSRPGQAGHLAALIAVWGAARGQGRRRCPAVARDRGLAANRERWPAEAGPCADLDRGGDPRQLRPSPDRDRAAGPGRRDQGGRPRRPPGPGMARIPLGPLVPDLGHLRLPGAMAVAVGEPRPFTRCAGSCCCA